MTDPVGATLGVLSLASLFTVCADCFDYVQTGRDLGKDFTILESQFQALRLRFLAWGKAAGFTRPEGYDQRLNDPTWRPHIQGQLNIISLLFLDREKLVKKYELQDRYEYHAQGPDGPNAEFIEEGLQDMLQRIRCTKRQAGISRTVKWVFQDKKEFEKLLHNLKEAIEQLQWILQHLDLFEHQSRMILEEVQLLTESDGPEDSVPLIEDTTSPAFSDLSDRLAESQNASSSKHEPDSALVRMVANKEISANERNRRRVCWCVPFERNPRFVGRIDQLHKLEDSLFQANRCTRTAIIGLGGVGKTQIALELAYMTRAKYPDCSIFWVPATNGESFQQAYREIGRQLKLPGLEDRQSDFEKLVQQSLNQESIGQWLLIVDNADDGDIWIRKPEANRTWLTDYLPRSSLGSIVFTTRNRKVAVTLAGPNVVEVTEMDEEVATQMLHNSLIDKELLADSGITIRLLKALTFLPLAIAQAAAYVNQNDIALQEYLSLLNEREEDVIELLSEEFEDEGRYQDAKNPIATTWLISLKQIQSQCSLAVDYLSFMSCLNPKNIPQSLLPPADSRKMAVDAVGILSAYSFVTKRPDLSLDFHRLVHLVTRNWLTVQGLSVEWTAKAVKRLEEVFPSDSYVNRGLWKIYLPHARFILESDLFDVTMNGGLQLMDRFGRCLYSDGRYNEAEKPFLQALEVRKRVLGQEHPSTLTSMAYLTYNYRLMGQLTKAETLQREVLTKRRAIFGENHPETLQIISEIVSVYYDQGKYTEVEKMLKQVMSVRKEVLGEKDPATLKTATDLCDVFRAQRRYMEAENLGLQTVHNMKEILGERHPTTLLAMAGLAATYSGLDQLEKAESLKLRVLELRKALLGDKHPATLMALSNLAATYCQQHQWAEAEGILVPLIKVRNEVLGERHPETLRSMLTLTNCYIDQKRWNEAETICHQLVEGRKVKLGDWHHQTLWAMHKLAFIFNGQGRFAKASDLWQRVMKMQKENLGEDHQESLEVMRNLACNWEMQGQLKQATDLMQRVAELRRGA